MGFPVACGGTLARVFVGVVSAVESLAKSFFFSFFFASSLMCANNVEEMDQEASDADGGDDTSLPFHLASFSSSPLIIPFHDDSEEEGEEQEVGQCSVCLDDLRRGLGRLDGCGHVFHAVCIGEWIHTHAHSTCPLCRCQVAYY